ncbi:MAG: TIGR00366 family protein [Peptococcaceae bacterium]|nr:TIGR00366 family protein [Peptococcaceae bacterium]
MAGIKGEHSEFILTLDSLTTQYPGVCRSVYIDRLPSGEDGVWGDAWTNMIQPFWALPLLAIAKLGIKDIMGYCTMVLLYTGAVISLAMLLL